MEYEDISEIEEKLEGLSLKEKIDLLEEVKSEIENEIEELESFSSKVDDLLSEVKDQMDNKLTTALSDAVGVYPEDVCQLVDKYTIDIEGLQLLFFCDYGKLEICLNGRYCNKAFSVANFSTDFQEMIKNDLPQVVVSEMKMIWQLAEDADVSAVIRRIVDVMVLHAEDIAKLVKKYNFV